MSTLLKNSSFVALCSALVPKDSMHIEAAAVAKYNASLIESKRISCTFDKWPASPPAKLSPAPVVSTTFSCFKTFIEKFFFS